METQLLVASIGHAISGLIAIGFGAFVFAQNPKRNVNIFFGLFTLTAGIYGVYFAIGINLPPSPLAYFVWFLNVSVIFVYAFYLHFILAVTKQIQSGIWFLRLGYLVGSLLFIISIIFPHLFLPEVTPKLFVKSYLNAGPLYVAFVLYSLTLLAISTVYLVRAYFKEGTNRRQVEYLFAASCIGFGTGLLDFFLVFDVPVSPVYSIAYSLYVIPIAYGVTAADLLDIRVVIKRTFFYTVGIAFLAALLTAVTLLNNVLFGWIPWLQVWTVPTVTAVVAFMIGRTLWKKSQEAERLKSEFIANAAHQLRTPLTAMKWSFDLLQQSNNLPEKERTVIIQGAAGMANMERIAKELMMIARIGAGNDQYKMLKESLVPTLKKTVELFVPIARQKEIELKTSIPEDLPLLNVDAHRLGYAFQNLLDNAIKYTDNGGTVELVATSDTKYVTVTVSDTGIGLSEEDRQRLFERFFRGKRATQMFRDGSGLGLSVVKEIIDVHGGTITAESKEGSGTKFIIRLVVG